VIDSWAVFQPFKDGDVLRSTIRIPGIIHWHHIFPYSHPLKFWGPITAAQNVFFYLIIIIIIRIIYVRPLSPDKFSVNKRLSVNLWCPLLNDTNLNNFHRELYAVRTFTPFTLFAALQSGARWRMKMEEPHCGLCCGKITNVTAPSSVSVYATDLEQAYMYVSCVLSTIVTVKRYLLLCRLRILLVHCCIFNRACDHILVINSYLCHSWFVYSDSRVMFSRSIYICLCTAAITCRPTAEYRYVIIISDYHVTF